MSASIHEFSARQQQAGTVDTSKSSSAYTPAQPWALTWTPSGVLRLRLSVDDSNQNGDPIRRESDLPVFVDCGTHLTDPRAMRRTVKTEEQHLAELRRRYPFAPLLAVAGNGNLLSNFGFMAMAGNRLLHLAGE